MEFGRLLRHLLLRLAVVWRPPGVCCLEVVTVTVSSGPGASLRLFEERSNRRDLVGPRRRYEADERDAL